MNPNPNPTYNVIKGLQIFISDIRGCTTKEAELKRVEKELDKIRKKFTTGKALTGYEKKKCVWKLLYIYVLGYKVDFGFNYAADLITSTKFSEKMTGYISMSKLMY
jgi:AP-2 complex subunit alpha